MQGLWLEQLKLSWRADLPLPTLDPADALIRMHLAGICATDLELVKGYYPFTGIPGHEFVGIVEKVGDERDAEWIGRRVVGEINIVCGECRACRAGRSHHCERRSVLGILNHPGVFAEYLSLPIANLHCIPAIVPDEAAVFVEPLAAALEIQQQIHIDPASRVLVIGAGRLGQLISWTLALTGCDLSVVARHPHQKALLMERKIAVLDETDLEKASWDVVIEATGVSTGFALARKTVRPMGTIILKSTYHGDLTINASALVVDEVTVIGSRCGPFEPALRMLANGLIDPRPLIEEGFDLENGLIAFEKAKQPAMLKVLLKNYPH